MLSKKFTAVAGAVAEVTDDYFKNVTMLLAGDGTNGAQNNTFTDSSTNNFTITRNGNTTQGSYSPYGSLWSNYFNGASTLAAPANAAFTFGTGDFTVEGWLFPVTANSTANGIFQQGTSFPQNNTTNTVAFGTVNSGRVWQIYAKNTNTNSTATWDLNTWYHFAVVRNSGTTVLYINGVSVITLTSDTTNYTGTYFGIGQIYSGVGNHEGYISNVRVVNGTAVYTSAFTPPTTPLTAISGTSFLTCQSNRFIDNSSNAFAITVGGTPSVQRFSPFNPTAAYSTATIGGSGYFDGSGDYLTTPATGQFAPTGNFTIGFWCYPTAFNAYNKALGNYAYNYSADWLFEITSAGTLTVYTNGAAVRIASSSGAIKVGQWQYIGLTRSGTTITAYVNGSQVGSPYTQSGTFGRSDQLIYVGASSGGGDPFTGYISDVLLIDGSVVSSVPTSPSTAVSGTQLLLNMTNAGIPDSAMMNDLETVGNAQISTSVVKYGTGSLYFDGAGDYLKSAPSPYLALGSGDFTIEFWAYLPSYSSNRVLSWGTTSAPIIYFASGYLYYDVYGGGNIAQSSIQVATTTWTHCAVVRSSGTTKIYINGVQGGSASDSNNWTGQNGIWVGTDAGTTFYTGYIDDLRITKGYARYTSNFTAPTAAFPTY
jgi:hypothetical protein